MVAVFADSSRSAAERITKGLDLRLFGWQQLAIFLAVTLLTGFLAKLGFHNGFVDAGHDGYQLRTALDIYGGSVLFKETFTQYGFLTDHLNALALYLFGERLLSLKYLVALSYGFTAVALFQITTHLNGRVAGLLVLVFWTISAPFYRHGIMISPHAFGGFFQLLALAICLRYHRTQQLSDAIWLGVLSGLLFLTKQNVGIYQAVGLASYFFIRAFIDERRLIPSRFPIVFAGLLGGFFLPVIPVFLWLFATGSYADWYAQTITFPRSFYLDFVAEQYLKLSLHFNGFFEDKISWQISFLVFTINQSPFWMLLRLALGIMCLVSLRGPYSREASVGLLFLTFTTLGLFPSTAFMHQWWSLEIVLPVIPILAVGTLTKFSTQIRDRKIVRKLSAAGLGLVLASALVSGFYISRDNFQAGWSQVTRDCVEIEQPGVFQGICSPKTFQEDLAKVVDLAVLARDGDETRPVASVEREDGYATTAMTLLVIAAVPENRSPHPALWELPVLSDKIYTDRRARLSESPSILVDYNWSGVIRALDGYKPWGYVADRTGRPGRGWVIHIPQDLDLDPPREFAAPALQPVDWEQKIGREFHRNRFWMGDGWLGTYGAESLRVVDSSASLFFRCPESPPPSQTIRLIIAATRASDLGLNLSEIMDARVNGNTVPIYFRRNSFELDTPLLRQEHGMYEARILASDLCREEVTEIEFRRKELLEPGIRHIELYYFLIGTSELYANQSPMPIDFVP